jgi:CDP-diacylglycerol--serine O-phosphatidyltransferase
MGINVCKNAEIKSINNVFAVILQAMSIKKQIPNALTLGNLLCGVLAIIILIQLDLDQGLRANLMNVFFLIGLALVLDFLDGMVARLLGVSGPLGKELDSLADVVSFGVFPALLLWKTGTLLLSGEMAYWALSGLFIAPFAAYRLAKFNLDTRPGDVFYGLPTPANTLWMMAICGTALVWAPQGSLFALMSQFWAYPLLALVSSWLMLSDIPLLSLKFKNFGWSGNGPRYLLIVGTAVLFAVWGFGGVAFVIPLYLILSFTSRYLLKT